MSGHFGLTDFAKQLPFNVEAAHPGYGVTWPDWFAFVARPTA